jgi:peroxiredoxin (alkyl hydroperoxide reductase subunit C)
MLGVGHRFPAFSLQATVSLEKGKAFQTITDQDYKDKWKIYLDLQEVLRVLDALQTEELCPCNWQKGEEVLNVAM